MKLISVVIPSYNYENYLRQAVSSVAAQTYEKIELVLVDDASADGSAALVRALAKEYEGRFHGIQTIFHPENKGAHATINEGIRAAAGELAAILNADDLYEPGRLKTMATRMDGARFAFSAVRCVGEDGAPLQTEQARAFEAVQDKLLGVRFAALSAVAENTCISTGNLLFEKKLFEELRGFRNYKYVHDYDFFLRACLETEPAFVRETAYLYRLHGQNSFTRLAKEGLRENRMVWLDLYYAMRTGCVKNAVILQNAEYEGEFRAAVRAAGRKKQILWRVAKNPLVRAGLKRMQRKYCIDSRCGR